MAGAAARPAAPTISCMPFATDPRRQNGAGSGTRYRHRGAPTPPRRQGRAPECLVPQGYAVLVQDAVGIAELSRADFLAYIETFLTIYAAAMGAGPDELPSREVIMQRHAGNPGFRALAVYRGSPPRIVAFTYGFHGQHGQWWHDVVHGGITARADVATADGWLNNVVEVAEVHVHPDYQARGIGRQMVLSLTAGRSERTAVLSTRDGETPARRLYRSLGFVDLLTGFLFPGGGPAYAVMGATLPLLDPG